MERVKTLFLSANPSRDLRLDVLKLDEEFREITAKIRSSDYRDALELIPCLALRPDDLRSESDVGQVPGGISSGTSAWIIR